MSRKKIIAGNWKMNKKIEEVYSFIEGLPDSLPVDDSHVAIIGAPAVYLTTLREALEDTPIQLAAQNCFWENKGAYTGENSPSALASIGVSHVIIGHSERRQYFHESDQEINQKAQAIFANGMVPIICCGESLETYQAGQASSFVADQIKAAVKGLTLDQVENLMIAYEPIWAIGTGQSATQEDAQRMCQVIRQVIAQEFSEEVANQVHILYGGSVKPANIGEYLQAPDVDGALVGGASLEVQSFLDLLEASK